MKRRVPMRRSVIVVVMFCAAILGLGCTPKVGLIALESRPQGAAVYLNQDRVGETPVTFEFNLEKPVTLRLEKDGYFPKTENLNVGWVKSEYQRGNLRRGDYMIQGTMQKGWEVTTIRDLIRIE
jgi:hypothetical protein